MSSNYSTQNTGAAGAGSGSTLDKDAFLKLLVTQLRHQDPLQPLQDREFIAQMAQFTALEQIKNMADEISLMRQSLGTASNLIGQTVGWYVYNQETVVEKTGTVEAVVNRGGKLFVVVEGEEIAIADLFRVGAVAAENDG
jgi:flagellar basal-body rod modification protein FlgD